MSAHNPSFTAAAGMSLIGAIIIMIFAISFFG